MKKYEYYLGYNAGLDCAIGALKDIFSYDLAGIEVGVACLESSKFTINKFVSLAEHFNGGPLPKYVKIVNLEQFTQDVLAEYNKYSTDTEHINLPLLEQCILSTLDNGSTGLWIDVWEKDTQNKRLNE